MVEHLAVTGDTGFLVAADTRLSQVRVLALALFSRTLLVKSGRSERIQGLGMWSIGCASLPRELTDDLCAPLCLRELSDRVQRHQRVVDGVDTLDRAELADELRNLLEVALEDEDVETEPGL